MINTETIEGRVFQHDLKIKTVQNSQSPNFGKAFIQGNLEIATDEAGLNVVKVHYTYVSAIQVFPSSIILFKFVKVLFFPPCFVDSDT